MKKHTIEPAKPLGMEIIFYYACPYCSNQLPILAPTQASMISCIACQQKFPIVPVAAHSIEFIRTMLGNGPAAIDPDFF